MKNGILLPNRHVELLVLGGERAQQDCSIRNKNRICPFTKKSQHFPAVLDLDGSSNTDMMSIISCLLYVDVSPAEASLFPSLSREASISSETHSIFFFGMIVQIRSILCAPCRLVVIHQGISSFRVQISQNIRSGSDIRILISRTVHGYPSRRWSGRWSVRHFSAFAPPGWQWPHQ